VLRQAQHEDFYWPLSSLILSLSKDEADQEHRW
jgi:hypothetical protein